MRPTKTIFKLALSLITSCLFLVAHADDTHSYTEQEFLSKFSGKSRQEVTDVLGKPIKKDIATKPRNTDEVLKDKNLGDTSAKEVIEMWYYKVKINYAPKKFFNTSELTFVNDKCVNITFANKK